jgi:hypothetical protein
MSWKDEVFAHVDSDLTEAGFRREAATWRRSDDALITICQLQKDPFGNFGYLNLGFYLTTLGPKDVPSERDCHVKLRAGDLAEGVQNQIDIFMDFERVDMPRQERISGIHRVMEESIIPFLEGCRTVEGLADSIKRLRAPSLWVRKEALRVLESE